MANENEILRLLRQQVGLEMTQSADFDVLAQAIADATGERLGVNTLKRLFGYKTGRVAPRLSTMDVLARYLGYPDYRAMLVALGEDADISAFTPVECLEVESLQPGAQVLLTYDPGRRFLLHYLGDFRFRVEEAEGSRNLREGDILSITQLAVGHRLVVAHVYRDGRDLGPYESAKYKGLKTVESLNP